MRKITLFLLLTVLSISNLHSQNLITNGDFETSGGYTSNYNLYGGSNSSPKDYAILNTPLTMNSNYTNTCVDHTTGTGKMMVVDGSNSSGDKIWEQVPAGGISVTAGVVYTFSYWIQSVSTTNAVGNLADIEVRINNTVLTPTTGSTICPSALCSWTKVVYTWTATSNFAQIYLYDRQTSSVGNDFALDDLSLRAAPTPLSATYSSINPSCPTENSGSISLYGIGGVAPYTFSIVGPTSAPSNNSGFFPNLLAGSYTITITDSTSNTITLNNIVISDPINPLVVSSAFTICEGIPTTLTVSGGSNPYTWTASPSDATLTTPNLSSVVVSPIVTTTYTVSSNVITTKNLVYNGDFSLGNVGFVTDYQFLANAPVAGIQKAFGIAAIPTTWFTPFSTCGDHTSGSGNMMVVDGSTSNAGNDKVWSQTIPVTAGQNYTFSYWIQSVTNTNLATINAKINGIPLGIGTAPNTIVCGNWTLYSYIWNSGASTSAIISLSDSNVASGGNDFALDDITFTTSNICTYTKSVIVTVNPKPIVTVNSPILCSGTNANIIATPVVVGTYSYAWTVPSGETNPGNVPSFQGATDGIYSVVITNTATGCFSASVSVAYTKPTVTISNTSNGCSSQITATPGTLSFGDYSYLWTVPSGATNPGNVFSFVATVSGIYTVTITNLVTNCASNTSSINLVLQPLTVNNISNIIVCNNTNVSAINFTGSGTNPNIVYSWTNDNNLLFPIGSSGTGNIPSILATNNTNLPIIANISVIATLNGCPNSATVNFTVTINPKPKVAVNNITRCMGDNSPNPVVIATPAFPGSYTYQWTVPADVINPGNVSSFTPLPSCISNCSSNCVRSYTVIIIDNATGCISDSATGTVSYYINCSINPNPPICPNDQIKIASTETLCNNSSCTTLSATYIDEKATTDYTVQCIPYLPIVPNGSAVSATICNVDDRFSDPLTLPFSFSFFGNCYTKFQVGTNTLLTFTPDPTKLCFSGIGSGYAFTQTIPSGTSFNAGNPQWLNAIYFPMQDTNPGVPSTPAASFTYTITGIYPCRKAIIDVKNLPLFSCGTSQGLQESQLVLYESTNIIDIYVKKRSVCAGWNSGSGVLGIQNAAGTSAYFPPGRNTGAWTTTNEAWRFTPSGASIATFKWYDGNGNQIGTTPTISVCPTQTTTYTAEVKYAECPGVRTVTQPTTIEVFPDDTQNPIDLVNCEPNNTFNLTLNEANVVGSLPIGSYDITYHTSHADAQSSSSPISNPTAFISNGQPIYMALQSVNNICVRVKEFNLIVKKRNLDLISNVATTNQTLCKNNPIQNIVYEFGGEFTGATVTGLPLGVSYSVIGNSVFIFGSPTVSSATPYSYTISATGGSCGTLSLSGTISVPMSIQPVITCGTSSLTSVEFNWNSLTGAGATDYSVTYQVNSSPSITIPSIGNVTTYSVGSLTSGDSVSFILTPKGATSTCFSPATISCIASACPTITNPSSNQSLCLNGDPTPFSVNTTFTGSNSISYVYFTTQQTGTSMYTGGTLLGTATPNAGGIATYDASVLGSPGSLPNATGTYYVYVIANPTPTDATCRPFQEIIVVVNPILSPSITCGSSTTNSVTFNWPLVSGATSYTETHTINSGTPTAITNISNVGTLLFSGLNPNDSVCITITPIGATGTCFASSTFCCIANPCVQPTVTVNSSTVCDGQSTTITATPGAAGTYSYAWTVPTLATNPGNVASFTTTVAGTYSVVITDTVTGCVSASASGVVTLDPLPTVTVNSPRVCDGQSATVTATPGAVGTYSYAWTGPTTIGNVATFTTSTAGTYSVVITNTVTGCVSASASGVVTLDPLPTVTVNNPRVCQGQSATVTATPGAAGTYSYVWTVPASVTNPGNVASFPTTVAGTYSVVITNTVTGCVSLSASGVVTLDPLPTVTVNSPRVCDGQLATVTATPGAVGTYSYVWTVPTGGPTPGNVATFNTTVAGTYSVVITNTVTTCVSLSASGTVTLDPLPTVTVNSPTVCQGAAATVTATPGAVGAYSYVWTVPTLATNPGNVATFNTTVAGTYSVVITNTVTGCVSASASGIVTLDLNPTVTVNSPTVCQGQPAIMTATPGAAGAYSYAWTVPGPLTNPGNTATFNTTTPGTYSVIITNTATGCISSSASGTPTFITAPTINTPTPYQVCDDNNDGISCLFNLHTKDVEISTQSGIQITYHYTPTDAQTGSNPITMNPFCNIISAYTQTLYVRVFDPLAPTCSSFTTLNLIVNPKPLLNANLTDYELCDNNAPGDGVEVFNLPSKSTEIINGQTSMVVKYYFDQNDALNNPTNTLLNLYQNVTPNSQTIWYTITNTVTGCISVGSFKLIVNPLPTVTVNSPTVCMGQAATITATAGVSGTYTYVWSVPTGVANPGNVATFTTMVAGVYSVVITNTVTGCVSASASGTVNHITAPTITSPTDYVVCDDNNDGISCLFNLHTKDVEISTQPGIQITYHYTPTDAQTGSNAIIQNPYCNINSVNTQTLYVRVFDPLAPACSSFTTLKLIVTPKPVAHLPADYHLCDDDTDGSVAFNLTGHVTPQVLGTTLSSPPNVVTYYESLADAQGPLNAIVGPSAYPSTTKTIWVRVDNTTTGCYDIVTVKLVVDPLPLKLPFYPQYELCETIAPLGIETFDLNTRLTAILLGQTGVGVTFYPSLTDATNNTNVITTPSAYTNTQAYAQTLGIRLTNTATGCYVISTMDLIVNPKPQPKPQTKPYTVCDTDQDGVAGFDLTTLTPDLLMGAPGVYNISYYLTQTDATTPLNPINTSTLFFNNNNSFVQFLFVRAEDPITHCFTVIQVELRVDPAPVAPLSLPVIANCDTDANPQDGCTTFNLSAQTPAVLALQPLAGTNYTVTYYTSQANATTSPNGTAPIINTTNYTACAVTTIWVRVQNKTTGCFAVGSFDVQVNTPIVLTTPTLLSVCDNDTNPNNLYTTFDMSGFVGTVPGHTLAFFLDANHTQPILTPGAFVNTVPATQTVFIVATNNLTGCKSYRTLTVVVLPVPTPRTNLSALPLVSCDVTSPNDGYEVFDLTTNAAYIMNGDTNVTLHYYPTKADAIANTNEIKTGSPIGIPTAANVNQNVWIRVESNYFINTNNEHCYVLVEQPIKVNPLPLVKVNYVYQECDDDTDGFTLFHLSTKAADMLQANPVIAVADCTFAFYEDAALSIPINATSYTNLTNPQTIYVVVTHTPTGCKSPVTAITLEVNPKPVITVPANYATCDTDGNNNGYYNYPLDILIPNIIGTQPIAVPPATYSVTFYNSQADAEAATNAITNPSTYQTYSHIIWIRIENDTTHCYRTGSFETIVEQQPEPEIFTDNDVHVLCVSYNSTNHALDQIQRQLVLKVKNNTIPFLDPNGNPTTYPAPTYAYQWYVDGVLIPGATSSTYTVPIITTGATRQFKVEMTSSTSTCAPVTSANFEVIQSGQAAAIGVGYTVTNAFSENQIITINVEGWGAPTYQYSLDDGPRQTSPIFENVSLGEHIITIWDTKGGIASSCDPLVLTQVQTIDYPHYFTPNGDGINDYWNIVGLQNQPMAKIYVFDRYGKLIKQISPQSKGWDGTYNGNLMISTDYWFTVDYNEAAAEKQFKAHFTLKR